MKDTKWTNVKEMMEILFTTKKYLNNVRTNTGNSQTRNIEDNIV